VPKGARKKGTRATGSLLFLLLPEDDAGRAARWRGWLLLEVCSSGALVEERDDNLNPVLAVPALKGVVGGP
jgi:hypothetical protein